MNVPYFCTKIETLPGHINDCVVLFKTNELQYYIRWDQLQRADQLILIEMISTTFGGALENIASLEDIEAYTIPSINQSFFHTYRYMIKTIPNKQD